MSKAAASLYGLKRLKAYGLLDQAFDVIYAGGIVALSPA